ncbi:MAG: MBL fold metallo-hydrolase [Methanothrix sp.]
MNRSIFGSALLAALIIAVSATVVLASENLTVYFWDVRQGDSELIQFNNKNVLIDAGTQEMGPRVECYLKEIGVSSLDLLIATHPHSDHIGGLLTVLNDFPIRQVLDSGQEHTSQTFENYLSLIDWKNIPFEVAKRGQTIDLDPAIDIEVLSPPATHFIDDVLNQNSVVLKVTYENVSILFMGDAGNVAESNLLSSGYNVDADVLKVGHHGSSSASSAEFLSEVTPLISVIEVGEGNEYGHPTTRTLNALQTTGSAIYRTDRDGSIMVTTDGEGITVTKVQSRCSNLVSSSTISSTASVPESTSPAISASSDGPFVASSKSDKYHYPTCSAAKRIKSSNLITFASSAEARSAGYSPCSICNPP